MTPHFAPGHRLHHDLARDRWIVMAPERMFVPDEIGLEVLRLVDGRRDVAAIAQELAMRFDAPFAEITADVRELLTDLAAKGVLLG